MDRERERERERCVYKRQGRARELQGLRKREIA